MERKTLVSFDSKMLEDKLPKKELAEKVGEAVGKKGCRSRYRNGCF